MDNQHFDQLVKGVRDMKRHMAGKAVRGAVVTNVGAPDDAIRGCSAKSAPRALANANWLSNAAVLAR